MTPAMVFVLLCRWVYKNKQGGGLESDDDKRKANDLLDRLLQFDYHDSGATLQLVTVGGEREHGVASGSEPVRVLVNRDGVLCFFCTRRGCETRRILCGELDAVDPAAISAAHVFLHGGARVDGNSKDTRLQSAFRALQTNHLAAWSPVG